MSIRKNRIPLHGISNFRMTETDFYSKQKQSWNPIETIRQKDGKNIPSQMPLDKNISSRNKSQLKDQCHNTRAISQIRKAYKNRPNVWRIAKAWKFAEQGYVTSSQFKQNIHQIIGNNATDTQIQQIINKIDTHNGKIDIQSFLKIIYGQPNSFCFKPRLFDIKDQKKLREDKIDNLVDKLSIYQHALNKKSLKDGKKAQTSGLKIVSALNQNQSIGVRNSLSQNTQKTKTAKSQSLIKQEFSKEEFQRITQESFTKLKNGKKFIGFQPQSMLNINQNKKRFGATVYPSNDWYSPFRTLQKINNKQGDYKVKNLALTQKAEKGVKFLARIQKIRQMQSIQKQNIQKNQTRLAQKENNRLLRKKLDRQAYEYSSFIRNKWL